MADSMMGVPNLKFTNCRKAIAGRGGQAPMLSNASNYVSVQAMRTRLTAINGTLYSSARLDKLTVNDMIYALRVNDDANTIKQ